MKRFVHLFLIGLFLTNCTLMFIPLSNATINENSDIFDKYHVIGTFSIKEINRKFEVDNAINHIAKIIVISNCSSFVAVKHIMLDIKLAPGYETIIESIIENIDLFLIELLKNLPTVLVMIIETIV